MILIVNAKSTRDKYGFDLRRVIISFLIVSGCFLVVLLVVSWNPSLLNGIQTFMKFSEKT